MSDFLYSLSLSLSLLGVFVFAALALTGKKDSVFRFLGCFLLFVLLLIIFSSLANAAENSAPAESAITVETVEGNTLCPTEFNPDDLGWAMHEIAESEPKKFGEDIIAVEHRRIFSYFPDPEQRIFVGIKKWGNPDCIAELFSYGPMHGTNQKRVWAAIRSSETTIVFLLTEKGWEKGGKDKPETFVDCGANGCNLVFALYRDKIQVASRALPVEPAQRYYHFNEEPVE